MFSLYMANIEIKGERNWGRSKVPVGNNSILCRKMTTTVMTVMQNCEKGFFNITFKVSVYESQNRSFDASQSSKSHSQTKDKLDDSTRQDLVPRLTCTFKSNNPTFPSCTSRQKHSDLYNRKDRERRFFSSSRCLWMVFAELGLVFHCEEIIVDGILALNGVKFKSHMTPLQLKGKRLSKQCKLLNVFIIWVTKYPNTLSRHRL